MKGSQNNVTTNIDTRRAMLGITMADMERASGMRRQAIWRIKNHPLSMSLKQLRRMSMLLYIPVSVLTSQRLSDVVEYRLPPKTWLDTIMANRERYGFSRKPPIEWDCFVEEVEADFQRTADKDTQGE